MRHVASVKNGFVVPANFNCPGQVVVTGDKEGIENVEENAKEMGAKKVRILKTSGPFHTEKLKEASIALAKELENIKTETPKRVVIKNIDGMPYTKEDNIKEILAKHIISPVKFSKSLNTMLEQGIDTFIEIGPRENIIRLCKKNKRKCKYFKH